MALQRFGLNQFLRWSTRRRTTSLSLGGLKGTNGKRIKII